MFRFLLRLTKAARFLSTAVPLVLSVALYLQDGIAGLSDKIDGLLAALSPFAGWVYLVTVGTLFYTVWPWFGPWLKDIFQKDDVSVFDAAHYCVTDDWDAWRGVGHTLELARMKIDVSSLFSSTIDTATNERKSVPYGPDELAEAARNTKRERMNRALQKMRQAAEEGKLPIWSRQDSARHRTRIEPVYWQRHEFGTVTELQEQPEKLMTRTRHDQAWTKPFFHSLRTNKKKIEALKNSEGFFPL